MTGGEGADKEGSMFPGAGFRHQATSITYSLTHQLDRQWQTNKTLAMPNI
jgi:hypothetical protein